MAFIDGEEQLEDVGPIFTVFPEPKKKNRRNQVELETIEEDEEMQHSVPTFKDEGRLQGQPQQPQPQQRMSPTLLQQQMANFPQGSYDTPTTARQFHLPPPPAPMSFDFGPLPGLGTPQMDQMNPWSAPLALAMMGSCYQFGTPSWPGTPASLQSTPGSNDSGISMQDTSPETSNSHDNEEIYKVQGRLSLNNNSRQHSVSRAEVARRLQPPECMNSSTLASLFRRAKVQGGGEVMRRELQQKGLDLAPENRRRKHAETTCFSALTEEESILMAQELHTLVKSQYPAHQMVQSMINSTRMEEIQELSMEAHYAARFLKRIRNVADQAKVSVKKISYPLVNDPVSNQMRVFSALTHGFGLVDQKTWMDAFVDMADLTCAVVAPTLAGHQ